MWKYKASARFEFKLQDFWVGVFWSTDDKLDVLHIWVCLLPCFPLHIERSRHWVGSIDDIPF